MESGFTAQLDYAIETLSSPAGAIAMLLGVVMAVSLFFSPKVKWLVLTILFWVSTFAFFIGPGKKVVRFAFPLEQIRSNGRTIVTGMLLALLIPALISARGWRMRLVAPPLLAYFIFEMVVALRILMGGIVDRGLLSAFVYPVIFVSLGWGLSKWIHTWDDAHRVLKAFFFASVLFLLGSLYEMAANRSVALGAGRFIGTSGNPQGAAMNIALALPIAFYFVARPAENKLFRIFAACAAGILSIFLLWTGSRTGIVMAGVAIGLTFRTRIGRFLGVGLFVGIVVLFALQIYQESTITVSDMFLRGDTRTRVWRAMWESFLEQPVFGKMEGVYGLGENSYLSTAASFGLFGLIPLALFMAVIGWYMLKSIFIRKYLGQEKAIIDLCIGVLCGNLVGGMFEAHLLGTLTLNVFIIYVMCDLLAFAHDAARVEQYQQQIQPYQEQYESDDITAPAFQPYPAGHYV
jgi:hypothetical protein